MNQLTKIINKIGENRFKLLIKSSLIMILFALVGTFFVKSFSLYQSSKTLSANVDKAIYLLNPDSLRFNLFPDGIIPSDSSYTYSFSIQNYTDTKDGDINFKYHIEVTTTTNLPITLKLYRNQAYDNPSSTNLLSSFQLLQDEDNAWYKVYNPTAEYTMNYSVHTKDTYTIVVNYPEVNKSHLEYAGVPEYIEIGIYSEQIVS